MDRPQRAVFFLEEDSSVPEHSKPLMLEAVVFARSSPGRASSCGPMVCSVFLSSAVPVSLRKPAHACRRRRMLRFPSGRRI